MNLLALSSPSGVRWRRVLSCYTSKKRYHGPYKKKPTKAQRRKKKNRQDSAVAESGKDGEATMRHAYSRILIGRITLKRGVGFLGKTQVVVVVHFNNNVANKNKGFADEQKRFLSDLVALCSEFDASVLMGDFNMSFSRLCRFSAVAEKHQSRRMVSVEVDR